ncbi:carbohydrate ABC transporter permease [Caproicibacter sp.]|uniref:carbohydrate ABC transporter permease n=1 Tax=Caproicibacter sp. TaxID=2814884 RepID=UPI003989A36A
MSQLKPKTRRTIVAYCFMAPALVILFFFAVIPVVGSIPLAFCDYSVLGQTKFIGFANFIRAFNDPEFKIAILNSVLFVLTVPPLQILSILLAIFVNKKIRGISIFRVLYYIPVVTSMVAVSIIWGFLFDSNGAINNLLMQWGWISQPLGFKDSPDSAMLCIMFITIWQGLGYYMMLYLAGIQSIPAELDEAALIDGASRFQAMVKVKIPLLKPYVWFCTLTSLISAVGVFDIVFVLTQGGPNDSTMVINYYSYFKAFNDYEFGYSAAIGLVLAVITSVFSIAVFLYGKKGGGMTYDG